MKDYFIEKIIQKHISFLKKSSIEAKNLTIKKTRKKQKDIKNSKSDFIRNHQVKIIQEDNHSEQAIEDKEFLVEEAHLKKLFRDNKQNFVDKQIVDKVLYKESCNKDKKLLEPFNPEEYQLLKEYYNRESGDVAIEDSKKIKIQF